MLDRFRKDGAEPIAPERIKAFLKSVDMANRRIAFALVLYGGITPNEALALKWVNIDILAKRLDVWDEHRRRYRAVYGPGELFVMLKEYKKSHNGDDMLFSFNRYALDTDAIRYTTKFFGKVSSWHCFRLSYLVMASKTLPLELVSENMGIPSDEIKKYWERSPEESRGLCDKMVV
jgi:integrase